jgi:hypothetical protein
MFKEYELLRMRMRCRPTVLGRTRLLPRDVVAVVDKIVDCEPSHGRIGGAQSLLVRDQHDLRTLFDHLHNIVHRPQRLGHASGHSRDHPQRLVNVELTVQPLISSRHQSCRMSSMIKTRLPDRAPVEAFLIGLSLVR